MRSTTARPSTPDAPWADDGAVIDLGSNGERLSAPAGPPFDRRRTRLALVAGFLTLLHLVFTVVKLTAPASGLAASSDAPVWSLALRAAVAALAFLILRAPLPLSRRQVRIVEGCLFGFEMLVLLTAQYLATIDLIDRRDLVDAVAVQKNGVIRLILLMVGYGALVPRAPAQTARIVITMAAALILCHGLVLHHADTIHLDRDDLANHQIVMSNALFLIMGSLLATLAAWVLHRGTGDDDGTGQIGPYRLLRKLDEGGAGEVYLAEHAILERPCALKLLKQRSEAAIGRFEREMQAAAAISHPNVVAILDGGRTDDGAPFCAMEYLPGQCIADLVAGSGPMPASRAVYLGRQVCGALAAIHRQGFIHRDLSPTNIFVSCLAGAGDMAKVLDFGSVGGAAAGREHDPSTDGAIAGTPEYVAPEQAAAGEPIDSRADLYGLGALLHFMVTGAPPFERPTAADVLRAHLSEPLPSLAARGATLPADLEAVIRRCLAKRPEDRYADARAADAALAACGCAGEWSEPRAEAWWLERQSAQRPQT